MIQSPSAASAQPSVAGNRRLFSSTLAGNVSAASTRLNHPTGLAIDSSGNIYIAGTQNHAIRKISTGGTIREWRERARPDMRAMELPQQTLP